MKNIFKKKSKRFFVMVGFGICILICIFIIGIRTKEKESVQHRMQWYLNQLFCEGNPVKYVGDRKISIAIIDSGIDREHLDLCNSVKSEYVVSGLDKNKNNDNEHGTFVCGIIAGNPNDSDGILGINSSAEIISIDVSDNNGMTGIDGIIEAVEHAISMNVDIINISIMTKYDYEEFHNVIKKAYKKGIIIVAASGNDSDEKSGYPANYEEVISVGAYTKSQKIMYSQLENTIYLPGKNIVSTNYGDEKYASKDGTSVATPMMTGIISLVLSNEQISNNDIMQYFSNYYGKMITSVSDIYNDFGISK